MNDRRTNSLRTEAAKMLAKSEDLRAFALQRLLQTVEQYRDLTQLVDATMSAPAYLNSMASLQRRWSPP
jgi:hypothetical protein